MSAVVLCFASCPIDPDKKCGDAPTGKQFKSGVTKDTVCILECAFVCFEGEVGRREPVGGTQRMGGDKAA